MKHVSAMLIAAVLLLTPVYAFSDNLGYARMSLMEGDVQVYTTDAGDWGPASINGPLAEGDQVWVPEGGKVELQLNSGTYIRLDQGSALQILSMNNETSQFYVSQGHAYVYYDPAGGNALQVDTRDASTRAFGQAIFRIDITDQVTEVSVYKGYVETENSAGNLRVNGDEMLTLGQDTSGEIAPIGPPDDWEIWNKERNDSIYAIQEVSSPNLPGELKAYSPDFNRNGKWVYVAEYGNCWVPTVDVAADWAPYRNGRWIWRGGEYVWVGYEPWGWAPYHYGRWAFVDGVGWCWVPPASGEVYWSPGYVGWVKTGDYVAWVPLAPRETYYGRGYYGPHSVNVTNVNIAQVNVNVYKNVYVNNGVTVVNRSSFNTASPTVVHVNRNVIQRDIFLKKNINVAGPDIKPTRATYFGSGKIVPTAKMPPQHVREVSVRQLRESRPYVKEPGRSVMNRGAKPAPLPVIKNTEPRTPGQGKPAVKPVRPADKGKSIEPGPGPKAEHRGMIPPTVDKTGQPGSAPPTTPKFERKETISPVDKTKPVGPPSTPKGDHKEMMPPPIDKTKATAPSTAPKVERKEIMPPAVDKTRQTGPPPATTPKFERKEITPPPVDKAKPIVPPPAPKVERREITPPPAEKPKTLTPAPVPKVDRKETIQKPVEKPKPVAPVPAPAPAPKADKKAAETKDKGQKDKKKDDTNK